MNHQGRVGLIDAIFEYLREYGKQLSNMKYEVENQLTFGWNDDVQDDMEVEESDTETDDSIYDTTITATYSDWQAFYERTEVVGSKIVEILIDMKNALENKHINFDFFYKMLSTSNTGPFQDQFYSIHLIKFLITQGIIHRPYSALYKQLKISIPEEALQDLVLWFFEQNMQLKVAFLDDLVNTNVLEQKEKVELLHRIIFPALYKKLDTPEELKHVVLWFCDNTDRVTKLAFVENLINEDDLLSKIVGGFGQEFKHQLEIRMNEICPKLTTQKIVDADEYGDLCSKIDGLLIKVDTKLDSIKIETTDNKNFNDNHSHIQIAASKMAIQIQKNLKRKSSYEDTFGYK
jgi:hypothetical protein